MASDHAVALRSNRAFLGSELRARPDARAGSAERSTRRRSEPESSPAFESPAQPPNIARFTFLDAAAVDFYPDWDRVASDVVSYLRSEAGRHPYDKGLSDLVGELATRSDEFRVRWAAHNVRFHRTGVKRLHHPVVGDLTLSYDAMELTGDPGLTVSVYAAEPGSASQQALDILASWSATPDHLAAAGDNARSTRSN